MSYGEAAPMNDYPMLKSAVSPLEESKMQYLQRVKKNMLQQIELIDRAMELLEKNPEFAELNDLLRRI